MRGSYRGHRGNRQNNSSYQYEDNENRRGNRRYDRSYSKPEAYTGNNGDSEFQPNWERRIDSFDQMPLPMELLTGIYAYGFKNPSDIQALCIAPINEGRDILAQAQSGTGKTGAFAIGSLSRVDTGKRATQILVLSPTRELAAQTWNVYSEIGSRMRGLVCKLFIGGIPAEQQRREAEELPHVCVCTPGRAHDLISSGNLRVDNLKTIILDEADQLLSDNFLDDIKNIFSFCSGEEQYLCFSATIPHSSFTTMNQFLKDPVKILVKAEKLTLEGIKQFYVNVINKKFKLDTLIDLYGSISIQKAIIFTNSQDSVIEISKHLNEHGFQVSPIHAGMEQKDRNAIMKSFRLGKTRVLVSTDLLARGIDVQAVTLVINYEINKDLQQYIHRIGRAGRMGRKGVAINIVDDQEHVTIEELRSFYQTQIGELPSDIAGIIKEANDQFEEEK